MFASSRLKTLLTLAGFILLPLLAGGIGAIFTTSAIPTWYATLVRPWFAPPNWLFGPAWTVLYILMGVASFLIYQKRETDPRADGALKVYGLQLVLNLLWSVIFFGFRSILGGFIEILLLWVLIVVTTRQFYRISPAAGLLMIPYLVWVTFASILTFGILQLNVPFPYTGMTK
ncbi:TspO/MBR family protein [Methanosphaerula subterraneus]|uniref:TspO/MBR family protein n=1 Tax=Methanosphaerula subterraneus TaxID=3350244 RepID=UPI003F84705E